MARIFVDESKRKGRPRIIPLHVVDRKRYLELEAMKWKRGMGESLSKRLSWTPSEFAELVQKSEV
jgi:hypothetical protein